MFDDLVRVQSVVVWDGLGGVLWRSSQLQDLWQSEGGRSSGLQSLLTVGTLDNSLLSSASLSCNNMPYSFFFLFFPRQFSLSIFIIFSLSIRTSFFLILLLFYYNGIISHSYYKVEPLGTTHFDGLYIREKNCYVFKKKINKSYC